MLKRVLAVVLAICMMSAFLTACGIEEGRTTERRKTLLL